VGENFIFALEKLQRAGYDTVRIFEKRRPTDLVIADLLPGLKAAAEHNAEERNMFAAV
jgi:hypothetical protein